MLNPDRSWTRRAVRAAMVDVLAEGGIEHPARNAEWMLMEVLDCRRVHLVTEGDRPVTPEHLARLDAMLARRLAREPLQHILGHAAFYGLRMRVSPDVLIPRPETEVVVQTALERIRDRRAPRILDLGTGSGAIALACAHERPDAAVVGCDVSPAALAVARSNAADLGLDVTFIQADVLKPDFEKQFEERFDLVVSNPPYVPPDEAEALAPEVREHEPPLALFSSDDPIQFYRAIVRHAPALLVEDGWLVLETHADYGPAVADLLENAKVSDVQLINDLAGRSRVVAGQWRG
ncbi:MAG: peptide chain release factor N(5)-glutamine methyltransferase [Bacteroidetes bacterium]|jgi:release factor glutamine methyltransferase|nr:peptide chain release factor N(5)-glutamine methyltransferase [Bacteroidota bacterium]